VPDTDSGSPYPPPLLESLHDAQEAGFLGPGPLEPHLRHAEGFVAIARRLSDSGDARPARVLDLGSGGGLPGLVIATRWTSCELVLLDAAARRTAFLSRAVRHCGLEGRVQVWQERAEVAGRHPSGRGLFDGVVVRSFGPPAVAAECSAPFLRQGGWVIVSEPPEDPQAGPAGEGRWPPEPLARLGLVPTERVRTDVGFQVLRQECLCPALYPRRNGVPAKRPLF
jgi:16S rRNA (guanine527-N7)-methyltransferase